MKEYKIVKYKNIALIQFPILLQFDELIHFSTTCIGENNNHSHTNFLPFRLSY